MEKVRQRSNVDKLSLEMLAAVLRLVEQEDRLRSCSVVCKIWREAANLATSGELYCYTNRGQSTSLSAWLRSNKYASKVDTIVVQDSNRVLPVGAVLQLPADMLGQLQFLQLPCCTLAVTKAANNTDIPTACLAPAASTTAGPSHSPELATSSVEAPHITSISALTALKQLSLDETRLDLSDLVSCTALQRLWLTDVAHLEAGHFSRQAAQSSGIAPSTQALSATYAQLAGAVVQVQPPGAAAEGGDLYWVEEEVTHTQNFDCNNEHRRLPSQLTAALLQLTQLTSLSLQYSHKFRTKTQSRKPICASLSSLQQLEELQLEIWNHKGLDLTQLPTKLTSLDFTGLPAVTLETMPGLQHLKQLQALRLLQVHHIDTVLLSSLTQLQHVDLSRCLFGSRIAVQQLLAALRHMGELKLLDLSYCLREQATSPEIYSALTVSSELYWLDIHKCMLTPGAVNYIFPDSGPPKALKSLFADTGLFETPGSFERMSTCCPTLQYLDIQTSSMGCDETRLGDWQGLSTLTRLTDLRHLQFGLVQMPHDALSSIAACTQLEQLHIHISGPWTPGGEVRENIKQLTQLTGVKRLTISTGWDNYGCPSYYCLKPKDLESDDADLYKRLEKVIDSQRAQPSSSSTP